MDESEPCPRDRALAEDSQERLGPADGDQCAGARRGLVLGMDRRHPQVVRRTVVSAALYAAAGAKHLEPDQSRSCGAADRGRPHDAARPAAGGCRQGRWPLGRGLCPDPQRERSDHSRGSPRRHRGQPAGTQDLPHARPSEPVRAGVSDQQHENARRAREEDRGAGRHARARRDHRSANGREPPRLQTTTCDVSANVRSSAGPGKF